MNTAIIVAGGSGKRVGADKNKVFLKLDHKEIISHTVEKFEKSSVVNNIVIVTRGEDVAEMKRVVSGFSKVKEVVIGGAERQDSVFEGLKKAVEISDFGVVLIHNGCNPFVSVEEIKKSVDAALEVGASVCAVPVKDTVKRVDEGFVVETLDRKELWRMQTPQVIEVNLAMKAFQKAYDEGYYATDDVALVEKIGGEVKIVECSYKNFKITTQEDLLLARSLVGGKNMKVGVGQDSHSFEEGKKLIIGGIVVEGCDGLKGNSDGDVVLHALCNALGSAVDKGSISTYSDKMCLEEGVVDSKEYVKKVMGFVSDGGYKVGNVSIAIEAGKPKLEKYFDSMKESIANLVGVKACDVGITATSGEELTAFGQGKGIQAFVNVMLKND